MTDTDHNHSITGSWMGQYFYLGQQNGSAFEVIFVEIGGHAQGLIEGSVLDNCNLGEAMVTGSFTYPSLQFTKTYINNRLDPVEYRGHMNEEGTEIKGNWYIRPRSQSSGAAMGTWIATRGDSGEEFTFDIDETEEDTKEEIKRELEAPARTAVC